MDWLGFFVPRVGWRRQPSESLNPPHPDDLERLQWLRDQGSRLRANDYHATKVTATQLSPPRLTIRERLEKDVDDLDTVPVDRGVPKP